MLQSVQDQVVVITGGTGGYGRATAQRFHAAGARVIITGLNQQALAQAERDMPGLTAYRYDATSWADWQALFAAVMAQYGRADVLVNNAGGGVAVMPTVQQQVETVETIIALNLTSVVYGCMLFGKQMKAQAFGTIINLSSACATEAWPGFSVYAAAKSGVVSLSKGLYTELRPFNVRVTALIPGAGDTNFSKSAGLAEPPVPYALKPEDVAEAILHICQMPQHCAIEEYRLWGMDQEVIPL
jgi:NAD(P)-dependent dehydrogenase (short-subunit alcohol dehydrogenase family)